MPQQSLKWVREGKKAREQRELKLCRKLCHKNDLQISFFKTITFALSRCPRGESGTFTPFTLFVLGTTLTAA